jgi:hypothetical protein
MLRHVVSQLLTEVPEILTASISSASMDAISTSKTSVNFYEAIWRNIQEDSYLHEIFLDMK